MAWSPTASRSNWSWSRSWRLTGRPVAAPAPFQILLAACRTLSPSTAKGTGKIRLGSEQCRGFESLAGRDRLFAAVVVEAPSGLLSQPAGFHVLHQQRARPVLAVRQAFVEHV